MLDNKAFDLWADGYDKDVEISGDKNEYPFAGYKNLLNTIYKLVHKKENARILDIGFGTGILTKQLYDQGYEIYGLDFSKRMIEIAKEKMPSAKLFQADFSKGLVEEVKNKKFDYIISSYAMHHLTDEEKKDFINELDKCLYNDGEIIIGDIGFETRELLEKCRSKYIDGWDDDEVYFVFDELKEFLTGREISFLKISHCAGIIRLKKYCKLN